MAMEPITLFARLADPAAVAQRLRELLPTVELDGPDDRWRRAVVTFVQGKQIRKLTLTHDPNYYAEPNWSRQMNGMRGYFSRFPDTGRKQRAMMLTTCLHFSLGTIFDPDFDPKGDPRLRIVSEVAQLLDGVLFTPSSLRDAHGRILFGTGGKKDEDPDAVWPRVAAEVSITSPVGAAAHRASVPRDTIDDDAKPPAPQRVVRRALALAAVTTRAILEQDHAECHDSITAGKIDETYKDLLVWVRDLAIEDEFEPGEWDVLQQPLGELDKKSQLNATWRLEGLVVLAWALGRFEIPPHDYVVETMPLWRSLEVLRAEKAKSLLAAPRLRPREEIAALRTRLFALHWRLRNYYLRPNAMDFAQFARTCAFGPLDISGLPLDEGDLALRGRRIDKASREVFGAAHSAAQERHQAANWLCEGPEKYSEASVAT